jgi:hypothetical protein
MGLAKHTKLLADNGRSRVNPAPGQQIIEHIQKNIN